MTIDPLDLVDSALLLALALFILYTLDVARYAAHRRRPMTRTRMTTRLPDALQTALAARAEANHRSTNAELIVILTQALSGTPATTAHMHDKKLTPALGNIIENTDDNWARGVATAAASEYKERTR
jgi:plasmid stability protein